MKNGKTLLFFPFFIFYFKNIFDWFGKIAADAAGGAMSFFNFFFFTFLNLLLVIASWSFVGKAWHTATLNT